VRKVSALWYAAWRKWKNFPFFCSIKGNQSHLLDTEYDKYTDLDQYILASTIKAIDLGFTKGFTCYVKKIKFQDL